MDINTYLSHPVQERQEIVLKANSKNDPFWLIQLQIAIVNFSPLGLSFIDKRLCDEYWNLISKH